MESISLVQMGGMNLKNITEEHLLQVKPALWMTMIETAEIVAERYNISRERQDAICAGKPAAHRRRATGAANSRTRSCRCTTKMKKLDKATGAETMVDVTVDHDECNRPDTTLEGLQALKPVFSGGQQIKEGKYITAGNASQFSDGASACVVMDANVAAQEGPQAAGHLPRLCGLPAASRTKWASARCSRCRACSNATA